MLRRIHGEQGMAMIMAVLLSVVVVTLGTLAMNNAVHNSETSSYDRKRVQGIAAAEAGIDYYMSHLQGASAGDVQCSMSDSLTGTIPTSFQVSASFYDAAQNEIACPIPAGVSPDFVLVRSTGKSSADSPTRTMEAYIKLIAQKGNPFGEGAIFSDQAPGLNATVQINGNTSDDADVYTNGTATSSLSAGTKIGGNLFSQGDVVLNKNAQVTKDVHAKGSITMNQQSQILGNAISSTSSITSSGGIIHGFAKAATTITLDGNAKVHGAQIPNTPSDPPPQRTLPVFEYVPTDWTGEGYTITNFTDCGAAASFIAGITGGKHVVRITSTCTLNFANSSNTRVYDDLAIISDGGMNMDARAQFTKADGGSEPLNVHLFFGLNGTSPCDITMHSNTRFGSGLEMFLYTPCEISLSSAALVVKGQMFAGKVDFNSTTSVNYTPVKIPGLGTPGYKEDIVYIREVVG